MTREVSDSVREVQEETVSDVIHVLAAVHNHPVAFMNKLDAKCSLTPHVHAYTQKLMHTQSLLIHSDQKKCRQKQNKKKQDTPTPLHSMKLNIQLPHIPMIAHKTQARTHICEYFLLRLSQ